MTFLLFLGAGTSQPFKIPTMKEMVNKFELELSNYNREISLYRKIKSKLEQGYKPNTVDIESVFSVIDGIASKRTIQDIGSFAYYYVSNQNMGYPFTDDDIKLARKLRTKLENFIKKVCVTPKNDELLKNRFSRSYRLLFSKLGGGKTGYDDGSQFSTDWRAYTTNYDVLFEQFWSDYEELADYFTKQDSSARTFFDPSAKVKEKGYVKLHGSLSWSTYPDGRIVKAQEFTHKELRKKGVVILPNQQKDLYMHPWITLFQNFKDGLHQCNLWIVIGYSFNDEFILNVFNEAFKENKLMIIINPHAKEFLSKFPVNRRKQITALPIKFGDENFSLQFSDYLEKTKTIDIYIRTKSRIVGIKSLSSNIKKFDLIETDKIMGGEKKSDPSEHEIIQTVINPDNEEMTFRLVVNFPPPYDQNLEFQFITQGNARLSFGIHYGTKSLVRWKNQIPKFAPKKIQCYTKKIEIPSSSLFIG